MNYAHELRVDCHCGNLRLRLGTHIAPAELPLRRCTCSFCSAHGSVYTSDRDGEVWVEVTRPEDVSRYRNRHSVSSHTMVFLVCRTCGVAPLALSEIGDARRAVVNVAAGCTPRLDLGEAALLEPGDEELGARLARQQATWIQRVHLPRLPGQAEA